MIVTHHGRLLDGGSRRTEAGAESDRSAATSTATGSGPGDCGPGPSGPPTDSTAHETPSARTHRSATSRRVSAAGSIHSRPRSTSIRHRRSAVSPPPLGGFAAEREVAHVDDAGNHRVRARPMEVYAVATRFEQAPAGGSRQRQVRHHPVQSGEAEKRNDSDATPSACPSMRLPTRLPASGILRLG